MVGRVCGRRLYSLRNCKFVAHVQGRSESSDGPGCIACYCRVRVVNFCQGLLEDRNLFSDLRLLHTHLGWYADSGSTMDRTKTGKTSRGTRNIHSAFLVQHETQLSNELPYRFPPQEDGRVSIGCTRKASVVSVSGPFSSEE